MACGSPGADGDAPLTARQTDLRGPLALVVGSEGQGLGPAVRKRCDLFVRIPMRGAIGSLNAAVAGSVLLFEVAAQRDPDGTAGRSVAAPRQADAAPSTSPDANAAEAVTEPADGPIAGEGEGRRRRRPSRTRPTATAAGRAGAVDAPTTAPPE